MGSYHLGHKRCAPHWLARIAWACRFSSLARPTWSSLFLPFVVYLFRLGWTCVAARPGTPRPGDYQPAAEGEHRQAEPGHGTDGGVTPVETGRGDTDDLCCRLGHGGRRGVRGQVGLCHPWGRVGDALRHGDDDGGQVSSRFHCLSSRVAGTVWCMVANYEDNPVQDRLTGVNDL